MQPGKWRDWVWPAAAFAAVRALAPLVLYAVGKGAEVSWDARYYVYLATHPLAVVTGQVFSGPSFGPALVHYPPLLGLALAVPFAAFRSFTPTFLAVRATMAFWETAGLLVSFAAVRWALALPGKPASCSSPLTSWVWLAALLPWGWITTVVWVQDEILMAPFLVVTWAASVRDRPVTAAVSLAAGALIAKFYILAFAPVAFVTLCRRRRFAAALALTLVPLALYFLIYRLRFGVTPMWGYDAASGVATSLSIFTLLPGAADAAAFTTVGKAVLVAAAAAPAFYAWRHWRRGGAPSPAAAAALWVAAGGLMLVFNPMGQPEYLAWLAYLAPVVLVVAARPARRWWLAGAATALCALAWGWNCLNAVWRWAEASAPSARHDLAARAAAWLGSGFFRTAAAVCAGVYVAAWLVAIWKLRGPLRGDVLQLDLDGGRSASRAAPTVGQHHALSSQEMIK